MADTSHLPAAFNSWFESRGWAPRTHQMELFAKVSAGNSALLIAPTGGGKTLAGFLPSLVDLSLRNVGDTSKSNKQATSGSGRLHTLYMSPLKALASDIHRNLEVPIEEMGLSIKLETRSGDTPSHKKQRQKRIPPDILLTTPEQISLLLSDANCERLFADLQFVILDELHELVTSKRGDLLALALTRLRKLAPNLRCIGLSATIAHPDDLRAYLVAQPLSQKVELAALVQAKGGAKPHITILETQERLPWSGHSCIYALPEIYEEIKAHQTTLVFVNTRSQAERLFQELWRINDETLPIAIHHGSLDVSQRRKVEAHMAAGKLKAVVCTSSLDLGIDWGDIDLVINVGAPKGASRLAQRIGRANHRMNEASKAILVPSNRFEVLECQVALEASEAGQQDTPPLRDGGLDVLAQHIMCVACAAPFAPDQLYEEVISSQTYRYLEYELFLKTVEFVATGGYTLKTYEKYAKLRPTKDGRLRLSHPQFAQQYRLNSGTILDAATLKVRQVKPRGANSRRPLGFGGKMLGEIEEWFIEQLVVGDTFIFAGQTLRFEGLKESEAYVSRSSSSDPKIPTYQGGKFPLSTYLADGVRSLISDPHTWSDLPGQVHEWLTMQRNKSQLPEYDRLLVETFPRNEKHYLVCYPFEGRLVHQTLGMLLTRRLERAGLHPLGFVATEYSLALWGLRDMGLAIQRGTLRLDELFEEDMLGDDLEAWLAESSLMKRTFRNCAMISGLVERRHPGKEKTGRQITINTDLIYNVLHEHEPDHLLLQATWTDAATGLLDISRLGHFLTRIDKRITHSALSQVSPLSVPVLLEIGKEPIFGSASDALLADAADDLILEAQL
ncbi:DEAD-box ATP-dependent RNA helicase CshB [Pseudovibrio axinellae]|uniref:DEAD-box ATP-dependent RNA helicase CshB n=1 Tax=Pseudovibrio axinellae TaxID=989403 RepID=A0A165YKM5_9HYPH|nr:ligase-associated DNA damage response DEXH box helicase [Pseudovibrio axinellae]KZL18926.1 DEAD-box ATP-dependent RNA helicase CshB [Pseudovibrio axinellae]SEP87485.1 ATP-dependent helicase Lhr and Lhr-like helicase [Pseudovibrio axinellae]